MYICKYEAKYFLVKNHIRSDEEMLKDTSLIIFMIRKPNPLYLSPA